MKIALVDDGVGAFATLNKLKYAVAAEYIVVLDNHFPLGNLNRAQLMKVAQNAMKLSQQLHCDAVVFSSTALSMATAKAVEQPIPLFGCEAPVIHASTYTASQVLVVGDAFVARASQRFPNVIALAMEKFPLLAESGFDDREIVSYIEDVAEKYYGSFDCIAIGNSSMNLYKHCFSRVFPNAQIFDSLEGVARKLRKKYKKSSRDDSSVAVVDQNGADLSQKYNIFLDEF